MRRRGGAVISRKGEQKIIKTEDFTVPNLEI
jgi:hypothetical protein